MKRLALIGLLMAPASLEAWDSLCPARTGPVWNGVTGRGECQPGGLGDVMNILPTVLPGMIPTPMPTRAEPTPQPTFAYTAPTPAPTPSGLAKQLTGSAAIDFANTSSNACADAPTPITVTGAVDGDVVALGVPAAAFGTGISYAARVSAANTVLVRVCKIGTTAFNPPSGTFTARIIRP